MFVNKASKYQELLSLKFLNVKFFSLKVLRKKWPQN
jgi:hypothetical protein